jgi:5'-phosphate synthase pdxT subunit
VTVLARFDGKIVGVECGRLLATAFHPELTADPRVHERFAAHCRAYAAHGPG